MSVNAVRKQSSDEEVQALAKVLIKSWKKLLGMCVSVFCFFCRLHRHFIHLSFLVLLATFKNFHASLMQTLVHNLQPT